MVNFILIYWWLVLVEIGSHVAPEAMADDIRPAEVEQRQVG